jgi:Uma2 family endonuclease
MPAELAERSETGIIPWQELANGDRMSRAEFHASYLQSPKHFKAELIDGEVYVTSPLKLRHGKVHVPITTVLFYYVSATPGTECGDNVTCIFDDENEQQPDAFLRVRPEFGGRSRTDKDVYIEGPPELLVEVAASSKSIDLNKKRISYMRHGVLEYLVLNVRDRKLHWFDLAGDRELVAGDDGVVRVRIFPGLWIDSGALFNLDLHGLVATAQQGFATPEHAAFVAKLGAVKKG